MFSSVQLDFWLDLQARVGGPGTNCLFREAQCLSLALVLWTVSKVETKPDKRLGTGAQNEELKLKEDRAPTQVGQELPPTAFQNQVKVAILLAPQPYPFPLCPPQASNWVWLLPCLPGLALPRMAYPHKQADHV